MRWIDEQIDNRKHWCFSTECSDCLYNNSVAVQAFLKRMRGSLNGSRLLVHPHSRVKSSVSHFKVMLGLGGNCAPQWGMRIVGLVSFSIYHSDKKASVVTEQWHCIITPTPSEVWVDGCADQLVHFPSLLSQFTTIKYSCLITNCWIRGQETREIHKYRYKFLYLFISLDSLLYQ